MKRKPSRIFLLYAANSVLMLGISFWMTFCHPDPHGYELAPLLAMGAVISAFSAGMMFGAEYFGRSRS